MPIYFLTVDKTTLATLKEQGLVVFVLRSLDIMSLCQVNGQRVYDLGNAKGPFIAANFGRPTGNAIQMVV